MIGLLAQTERTPQLWENNDHGCLSDMLSPVIEETYPAVIELASLILRLPAHHRPMMRFDPLPDLSTLI